MCTATESAKVNQAQPIEPVLTAYPGRRMTIEDAKKFTPDQMEILHQRIISFARPQFRNLKWNKPKLSARYLATLRKAFAVANLDFPTIPDNRTTGKKAKSREFRQPKGHLHQRTQGTRLKQIEVNLAKMPKLLEDSKKVFYDKKPKPVENIWDLAMRKKKEKVTVRQIKVKFPRRKPPGTDQSGHRIFYRQK